MPNEDKPLPEDIEFKISRLAAQAADKLLNKNQAEVAQEQAMQQQQDRLRRFNSVKLLLKRLSSSTSNNDIAKLQADMDKSKANVAVQEKLNLKSGVAQAWCWLAKPLSGTARRFKIRH